VKIGVFEIGHVENTRWDYIVPWGLAVFEVLGVTIVFSGGYFVEEGSTGFPGRLRVYPSAGDWVFHLMELSLLFASMLAATRYLRREHRIVLFPLGGLLSFVFAREGSMLPAMMGGSTTLWDP
jgi:hypothetical protein